MQAETDRWPTATSRDWKGADNTREENRSGLRHSGDQLDTAAQNWATPKSSQSGPDHARTDRDGSSGNDLVTQISLLFHQDQEMPSAGDGCLSDGPNSHRPWRTPSGSEGERGALQSMHSRSRLTLTTNAAHWQTPQTDNFRSRGGDRKDEMGLDQQARADTKNQLNPRFVEWLMGFPLGWTGFEHSEMEWSRWWQRMRSVLSRLE